MPDLIQEVNGGTLGTAAIWGGILATSFAVMQFLFGPLLGSLSDRFGRRPILLVSLAVMAGDYVVMALTGSIWVLLIARLIAGVTAATQSAATAFIADISPPEKKAQNFGLLGAAFGIGFVLGPVIGGLLADFGSRAPFWVAAILATANLIFGYFVLPETVTDRIRRPFELRRANPIGAFFHLNKFPGIGRLLALALTYEFAFIVYPATWAYFTKERFGWEPWMVGFSLGAFGVAMAIVQGGLIRWIIPTFGERGTIIYGLVFNFFAFLILATVTSGTIALLFTPITALGAVVTPALTGLMSQRVPDDSQGELQGLVASTKSIALISAPITLTWVFWRFTGEDAAFYLPGAPFAVSACLMIVCAIVFLMPSRTQTV
jgi:DHA1 family tetracycline resistance protein-like MFS transporter